MEGPENNPLVYGLEFFYISGVGGFDPNNDFMPEI
jgi:hypothetical protein